MKTQPVKVKGVEISGQQIAAYTKQFNGQSAIITVWANFCAIHAVVHLNSEPLNNMLNNSAFRLSTGKLSALGREVFAYIKAHAPLIAEDSKTGRFATRKVKPTNPLFKTFVNPADVDADGKAKLCLIETDADGQPLEVPERVYDFALSFDEWRTLEKAEKEPTAVTVKATAVQAQLEKAMAAIVEKRFTASAEESTALLETVLKFQADLVAVASALADVKAADVAQVDAAKASELLKSGQAGKSTRAPKVNAQ